MPRHFKCSFLVYGMTNMLKTTLFCSFFKVQTLIRKKSVDKVFLNVLSVTNNVLGIQKNVVIKWPGIFNVILQINILKNGLFLANLQISLHFISQFYISSTALFFQSSNPMERVVFYLSFEDSLVSKSKDFIILRERQRLSFCVKTSFFARFFHFFSVYSPNSLDDPYFF